MTNQKISSKTNVVEVLDNIIELFKKAVLFIKRSLINNTLQILLFIIFFVLFPSVYYLYTFKMFNIVHNYPILTIVSTLLVFFSCLAIILLKLDPYNKKIDKKIIFKTFYNMFYLMALFLMFSLLFHISKFIVYNGTNMSITISFVILILFLSLRNSYDRENFESLDDETNDLKDGLFTIIKNIIFVIPCYIVDLLEFVKKNVSGLPASSRIISILIFLIIVVFYVFPILKDFVKNSNGITFVQKSTSLEKQVLYLTQKQLKQEIIESKPFARRNLLRRTNDFKTYLERDSSSISDLNKSKIIEGFDKEIHLLDKNIMYDEEIYKMNETEKSLVEKEMEKNRITYDDFSSPDKFKDYILSLRQEDKYYELLNKIGDYNNKKNDFIYQEASSLINLINRTNHIQDYNYHYGLSFWVYFDPQIQTIKTSTDKRGFIMTYSNSPKIFYDYNSKELKITVDDCENKSKKCSENLLYKSKDILFQRWNHFVVNYNYGNLDCFINGNLVLSKGRVAPYIENAFLKFGSDSEPLYKCGICNITYYDTPLNLTSINEIYQSKKTPCDV